MNILDENIARSQMEQLRGGRLKIRQIGLDAGRAKMQDEEIIPFLLTLRQPTFFTLDKDFYDRRLCHKRYCLVWLDVKALQVAEICSRLVRHPEFDTKAKRMGHVIRISPHGISSWQAGVMREKNVDW